MIQRDVTQSFNFVQIVLDVEGISSPFLPAFDIRTARCRSLAVQ